MLKRDHQDPGCRDDDTPEFSTLLASTVHDLKNSVTLMLNTLNEAGAGTPDDTAAVRETLARVRFEAMRINNDMLQLLALYKLDRGRYAVDIDQHNVQEVIEECVLQYAPLLTHEGISVRTACPGELSWYFDRNLVAGVLNNALNNALRHGGRRLLVKAEQGRDGLTIQVQDGGPGYPDHLLDAGPAAPGGVDFRNGNTGMGLYFAALAAGQHKNGHLQGHISLSNGGETGGGCFTLHLP
jgi:signal transduction histidine kinase